MPKNELLTLMRQVEEAQKQFRALMTPDVSRMLAFHEQVAEAVRSNRLLEQIQPSLRLHEQIVEGMQPVLKAQEQMREQTRAIWEAQQQIAAQLSPMLEMQKHIREAFTAFERIGPFIDQIGPAIRELPKRQRRAYETLAKNGWYFDLEMTLPTLWRLEELFEDSTTADEGDAILVAHYEKRLDEIEAELVEQFPSRATLFKQGFATHRAGAYALTVPFFLAQAEGICVEFTGVKLFARRNGAPALKAHFNDLDEYSASDALLHPLTVPSPLSASEKELGDDAESLNRHTVLHGRCVTYDKQINSCQALSILYFVARVLKMQSAAVPGK
jgi:hypothetical protein